MGLFSKPKYPKKSPYELPLYQEANAMQTEATSQYAPAMRARLSDIQDPTDERLRAARIANADTWQADAAARDSYDSTRPGLSAFARAMMRGKALTKSVLNSTNDVDMKLLRDRVAATKAGMGIRTGNVRDLFQLSAGMDAMNAASMQADQQRTASYANLAGTLGGIAARAVPWYMDQRSAAVMNNQAATGLDPVKLRPITVTAQRAPG